MKPFVCPCEDQQGLLVHVCIKPIAASGYICDECDCFWATEDPNEIHAKLSGNALYSILEPLGITATWDHLNVIDGYVPEGLKKWHPQFKQSSDQSRGDFK
jgi:hypothetical protein